MIFPESHVGESDGSRWAPKIPSTRVGAWRPGEGVEPHRSDPKATSSISADVRIVAIMRTVGGSSRLLDPANAGYRGEAGVMKLRLGLGK